MMNMMDMDGLDDTEFEWSPKHKKNAVKDTKRHRNKLIGGAVGSIVILAVVITVAVITTGRSGSVSFHQQHADLFAMIESTMTKESLPTQGLLLKDRHQYKAFEWLTNNVLLDTYDDKRRLQRFALACFYYSTFQVRTDYTTDPKPWTDDTLWLSDEHECQWVGVHCTSKNHVWGIALEDNDLSGYLPMELALLRKHLTSIDLTKNGIYMRGDELKVFEHLTNLESLLIDDNFLLTTKEGIPTSLGACTNLHRLRLSYNLMRGPLDNGVLDNMQKLTHLEVESNFLTGNLHFLGNMPALESVYLRRNSLKGHLNFLKSGKLSNLFSLWLDSNPISSSIPTQVGRLTTLASFSIANATLTGTLPSEMGQLTNLKRVWLFDNDLEGEIPPELTNLSSLEVLELDGNRLNGSMPMELCDIIEKSDFSKKKLTADCDQVQCECCTC